MWNYRTLVRYGCAAVFGMFTVPAFAALPVGVSTAMTTLETDGLALIDLVWVPVTALVVAFIIIKLFKRGAKQV